MDAHFLNAFIEATVNVLATQCSLNVVAGQAFLKGPDDRFPFEIAGVVSANNPKFAGSISLCFTSATFLKLYEGMVGEKHEKITTEIEDAAGEILNMIFGRAKTTLNDKLGYTLDKAIPTVLAGSKLHLRQYGKGEVMIMPFESSAGAFRIEIFMEKISSP